MAARISGAFLGTESSPFSRNIGGPPKTGQCFIALAPETFSGNKFYTRITILVNSVQSQKRVGLPGEKRKKSPTS